MQARHAEARRSTPSDAGPERPSNSENSVCRMPRQGNAECPRRSVAGEHSTHRHRRQRACQRGGHGARGARSPRRSSCRPRRCRPRPPPEYVASPPGWPGQAGSKRRRRRRTCIAGVERCRPGQADRARRPGRHVGRRRRRFVPHRPARRGRRIAGCATALTAL